MSHTSTYFECDDREAYIIDNRTAFRVVVTFKSGRDAAFRFETHDFLQIMHRVEDITRSFGCSARVYAVKGNPYGHNTNALYAKYNLHEKTWKWSFAGPENHLVELMARHSLGWGAAT